MTLPLPSFFFFFCFFFSFETLDFLGLKRSESAPELEYRVFPSPPLLPKRDAVVPRVAGCSGMV